MGVPKENRNREKGAEIRNNKWKISKFDEKQATYPRDTTNSKYDKHKGIT